MSKSIRNPLYTLLISTIIVIALMPIGTASPSETALHVVPSEIINTSIDPEDLFIINITITDVVNLYNWQIRLYWTDPDLLNCTRVWLPTGHIFDGMSPIFVKNIYNDTGYVQCGASVIPSMVGVVTADEGLLCQIEFEVQAKGSCDLEFSEPYGEDTFLLYALPPDYFEEGTIEPVDYENGYFRNAPPPPPAVLYVDPAYVVDPNLTACHDFTVNVTVAEVIDLYQWNFTMYYRNNVLEATNVDEGPFLSNVGATSFHQLIANNHNLTHGCINVSCALLGGSGADGNGTLATLTFHVLDIGNTTLTLTETLLKDSTLQPINHTAEDGYFNNMLVTRLFVHPPEIINPTIKPGDIFDIEIRIENVIGMYGYEFKLGYDNSVLLCLGAIVIPPNNETHFHVEQILNDTANGFIYIKVVYYPPAEPITIYAAKLITRITFDVREYGCSVLDLYDTKLVDEYGDPISHIAEDGFFCTLIQDIAVTNVVPSTTQVYETWLVYINVTVKNEGNLTETFDVKAYYGEDSLIGTMTVEDLDPENETTVTFTWNTTGTTPCNNYTIWAEAVPLPYEIDTADNIREDGAVYIKMLGDVDGDGKINMKDIGLATLAYGSFPGHPRWNPECDLNLDEKVNMRDIGIITLNYGNTC